MAVRSPRTPGERTRVAELLRLAEQEFGDDLSKDDEIVVQAAALGEIADFADDEYDRKLSAAIEAEQAAVRDHADELPSADERPEPTTRVTPSVIRWLLTYDTALEHVHAKGVQLGGVRIDGTLELQGCHLKRPLWVYRSTLQGIDLFDARCETIGIQRSLVRAGAMDGGPGAAIQGDGARVTGAVSLSDGFRAEGEVRLLGAEIGGNLECNRGVFLNRKGPSLNAGGARVTGGVYLRSGFCAEGEVNLVSTEIGGALDCTQGMFLNKNGDALSADGVRVTGDVFLSDGFRTEGQVRLLGAEIGGDLACVQGVFLNKNEDALDATGARVTGSVFFRADFRAEGTVTLTRAKVGMLNDPIGADGWPATYLLDGFRYDAIFSGAPLDAKRRLRWLANHDEADQEFRPGEPPDPQPYRQLADILRKQGHPGEASVVMRACARRRIWPRARQHFKKQEGEPILERLRKDVLGAATLISEWAYLLLVGHGYARWRVLIWALAYTLIGTIVFGINNNAWIQPSQPLALRDWVKAKELGWDGDASDPRTLLSLEDFDAKEEELSWVASYPQFNAVVYSLDTFLPLVGFGQESSWTVTNGDRWSGPWLAKQIYLPFHIASGWVIATLFAASFTRLMRPE